MSLVAMETSRPVEDVQFAEGTVLLGTDKWFCETHEITARVGEECAFCVYDTLGEADFEKWVLNRAKR